VRFM